jgi:CheY-like chemotaxis protein
VTAHVLGRAGYAVIEAKDGEQALQILRRRDTPVDLVISDVVMAKLGGIELARSLASERPSLPVLLISGYDIEGFADEPRHLTSFLQKPFTSGELLEKVAALLTASIVNLNKTLA